MMRRPGLSICLLALLHLPSVSAFGSATIAVSGTVLMADDRPASGARVELLPIFPLNRPGDPAPAATTATDAAGRFALEAPSPGIWKVVVRSAGASPIQYAPLPLVEPVELPPALLSAGTPSGRVGWGPVSPTAGTGHPADPLLLSGQILDETGRKPIPGALVWATAEPGAFARTDAEGRFQVPAPGRRRFDLEALAPGHLLKKVPITRPQLASRKVGTITLPRTGTLRGKVVDPQGRPVLGAMVVAIPEGARGERVFDPSDPVADRAVTDAQGRFALNRLRPERGYEVRATRTGSFPAAQHATVGDPAAQPRNLTLVLAAARAVRGKVQDPAGRPIADAEVVLRPAFRPGLSAGEDTEGLTARSDAKGVFAVPAAPAAEIELAVRKKGYAPVVLPAIRIPAETRPAGPADLGVVTLRPGAKLTGRVVDHRGQAVPHAEIFTLAQPVGPNDTDRALKGRKPAASTAADGRFSVEDLAQAVPVHLVVRAAGFLIVQARSIRPPTPQPVTIRLEPEAVLRGRVVDEGGGPVAGARIDLRWQAYLPEEPDRPVGEPILRDTRSEADGRFELKGIPAGRVNVGAGAAGFAALEPIEVDLPRPAEAGELRLVLERGAVLQGRVTTAAGEPVPAVGVGAGGANAYTNDDGLYWLEGAQTGRGEVLFLHPSYGRLAKPFDIQPGVNVLDVAFDPGIEVSGRVVDDAGKPVSGARVELGSENRFDLKAYQDVTGDDGRFRLSPVVQGRYRLKAVAEGYSDTELRGTIAVAAEPVSNLEIVIDKGAMLSGNILGLSPEDLAQVSVEARSDEGDTVAAWTDGRGRYEIRSLHPGDWVVRAALWEDQRQAHVRVPISRSDREVTRDLEFEKRLRLTLQVLYDEEPLPDARVSLRGQRVAAERVATTDYEGRIELDDLAPDTYRVGLRHSQSMLIHNDQIDLQQDRDVVLRLQGATVGGLVVSAADGDPVAGALLALRPVEGPEYLITSTTKADGRFSVHRVQPGRYRVEVRAQGFAPAEQELQVAGGQVVDNLEFRLKPAQGVRLQVRLASGHTPELVHLQVRDPAGATILAETRHSIEPGIFELSMLPAGSWTLYIRADGGALATTGLVVPSTEPLTVTLPPAGKLNVRVPALVTSDQIGTVRLLGPNQQPFWTIGPGGAIVQQWQLVGGKAILDGVPAGTWILQVETPDGQRWQGAATTAGAAEAAVVIE